jgi:hypothetical protein
MPVLENRQLVWSVYYQAWHFKKNKGFGLDDLEIIRQNFDEIKQLLLTNVPDEECIYYGENEGPK